MWRMRRRTSRPCPCPMRFCCSPIRISGLKREFPVERTGGGGRTLSIPSALCIISTLSCEAFGTQSIVVFAGTPPSIPCSIATKFCPRARCVPPWVYGSFNKRFSVQRGVRSVPQPRTACHPAHRPGGPTRSARCARGTLTRARPARASPPSCSRTPESCPQGRTCTRPPPCTTHSRSGGRR